MLSATRTLLVGAGLFDSRVVIDLRPVVLHDTIRLAVSRPFPRSGFDTLEASGLAVGRSDDALVVDLLATPHAFNLSILVNESLSDC